MSLPLPRSRAAEQFHLALEARAAARPGTQPTEPTGAIGAAFGGYVEVATRLGQLVPTTSLRPDPAYRAELHTRLLELASARATERQSSSAAPTEALAGHGRTDDGEPAGSRLVSALGLLGRRWRRNLAAGTAAVLALMLGVGVAAGSALPGGLLYPVKELIQGAQVQLAHGDLARGRVLLDQARSHITDASTLVSQGAPQPADVNTALRQASDDFSRGQRLLLAQYAASHRPAALSALSAFTVSQSPLIGRLRDRVPVVSEPLVDQLLAQIGESAATLQRTVAQCGAACADVSLVNLPGPDGLPAVGSGGPGETGSGDGATGSTGLGSGTGLGGLLGTGGLGGLGGTGGGAGAGSSGSGGVASLGSNGVGVNLPGVGATVPTPHVGISSGGVQVGVPGPTATVGPITAPLPGVSLSLGARTSSSTHPPENSSSTPPTVCLLIVCLGG